MYVCVCIHIHIYLRNFYVIITDLEYSKIGSNTVLELMVTSFKRAYATCCTQSSCSCGRPLPIHASTGDTQTLKGRSVSVSEGSLGPGAHKVLFEPSEHHWWVWGLILNVILPLPLSGWGFSFAVGCGVTFIWWDPTFFCQ